MAKTKTAPETYGWDKPTEAREPLTTRDNELGPKPVAPKAKRPQENVEPAKDAKGAELLAFLLESGTPAANLAAADRWLKGHAGASALDVYRFLEEAHEHGQINIGTLRKAGKWLWGAAWEPESAMAQAPAEEIHRLREQVATYESQTAIRNTELAAMKTRIDYLEREAVRLQSENNYLRAGRSSDDLAKAGIDPGVNLTTLPNA